MSRNDLGLSPKALGLSPAQLPTTTTLKGWPFKDPPPLKQDSRGRSLAQLQLPRPCPGGCRCAVCQEREAYTLYKQEAS